VISDGAEILKRLPRAMPKPTPHIIDWFHIAMKIQPMQQIADHMVRSRWDLAGTIPTIDRDIRAVKWRLWHGRIDRAIRDLERLVAELKTWQEEGAIAVARLHSLGSQLLTYIRSNRSAIHQLWQTLPSRPSRRHHSCRVGGQFSGRKADGEETADALVPARCPHADAGSDR
jgi:hypothetical protein